MFVPSSDFVSVHVTTFKSHFGFMQTFTDIANNIKAMSDDNATPYLSMNVDNVNIYNKNVSLEGVKFLDLSFYAPYKSIGDMLITAFVYIMFAWRFFSRIPDIISGVGMATTTSARISTYDKGGK